MFEHEFSQIFSIFVTMSFIDNSESLFIQGLPYSNLLVMFSIKFIITSFYKLQHYPQPHYPYKLSPRWSCLGRHQGRWVYHTLLVNRYILRKMHLQPSLKVSTKSLSLLFLLFVLLHEGVGDCRCAFSNTFSVILPIP